MAGTELSCHICGHPYLARIEAVQRTHLYCANCLHSQRLPQGNFPYSTETMCPDGYDARRLTDQADWIAADLPGPRVLEIGCGTGDLGAELCRIFKGLEYHGIELSPGAEKAKGRLHTVHRKTLEALVHNGMIRQHDFDAVVTSHTLEHIENVHAIMKEIATVLKPEGCLFIEVPNWSANPMLPFDDDATHLHSFSVNSLTRLMADHGLRAISASNHRVFLGAEWEAIRVVGVPFAIPQVKKCLRTSQDFGVPGGFAVWGAGNRALGILGNFLEPAEINFFVDGDARKQGSEVLGRKVRHPNVLADHPDMPVLIAAIESEKSIRCDMQKLGLTQRRKIISLAEMLRAA